MITSIKAKGPMVAVVSDDDGEVLITRKEALLRARAINHDKTARDLVEALIKAADEARRNAAGLGYQSKDKDMLLNVPRASDTAPF